MRQRPKQRPERAFHLLVLLAKLIPLRLVHAGEFSVETVEHGVNRLAAGVGIRDFRLQCRLVASVELVEEHFPVLDGSLEHQRSEAVGHDRREHGEQHERHDDDGTDAKRCK